MKIVPGDLHKPEVIDLVQSHIDHMVANSPPGMSYALDPAELSSDAIEFWTVIKEEKTVGCGALKTLNNEAGEIKSMRTHPDYLGQGVGAALLKHIINSAKARGFKQLLLETGRTDYYQAAIRLYKTYGFVSALAFGDYQSSDFNQFFKLEI